MIRPEWNTAPRWANFVAMDSSGAWYWYSERPVLDASLGMWCAGGHNTEAVKFQSWQESLSVREGSLPPVELTESGRAFGVTLDDWRQQGWTDETLIANGYARPAR